MLWVEIAATAAAFLGGGLLWVRHENERTVFAVLRAIEAKRKEVKRMSDERPGLSWEAVRLLRDWDSLASNAGGETASADEIGDLA